jgi:hypothetical protein
MPPLLAPKVMLPLSECSSVVWVQGQITGSTLEVFANGVLVASGTAFGSNILIQPRGYPDAGRECRRPADTGDRCQPALTATCAGAGQAARSRLCRIPEPALRVRRMRLAGRNGARRNG